MIDNTKILQKPEMTSWVDSKNEFPQTWTETEKLISERSAALASALSKAEQLIQNNMKLSGDKKTAIVAKYRDNLALITYLKLELDLLFTARNTLYLDWHMAVFEASKAKYEKAKAEHVKAKKDFDEFQLGQRKNNTRAEILRGDEKDRIDKLTENEIVRVRYKAKITVTQKLRDQLWSENQRDNSKFKQAAERAMNSRDMILRIG